MLARDSLLSTPVYVLFALALLTLGSLPSPALASWRVIPIRLDLNAGGKTGTIKVINEEDQPLQFQLKAARWTQDAQGNDVYEDTEDLVFFPRILLVPAGEERLIRAGFKVPATTEERAYRLFIEQIPVRAPETESQVAVVIRFGVPIFSAPLEPTAAGSLEDVRVEGGAVQMRTVNTGNINFKMTSLVARGLGADGEEVFVESIDGWYLLPGMMRDYVIPLPGAACALARRIEIEVPSDRLELESSLDVTGEQCAP
ncbi:MAG: molecular chaperone [Deltaproteobacteria bacterium]|nr:molecular chaperone [Deltaproteobacteria bacterium]